EGDSFQVGLELVESEAGQEHLADGTAIEGPPRSDLDDAPHRLETRGLRDADPQIPVRDVKTHAFADDVPKLFEALLDDSTLVEVPQVRRTPDDRPCADLVRRRLVRLAREALVDKRPEQVERRAL